MGIQEVTVRLATAREISADAAVATIFTLKGGQRAALKTFSQWTTSGQPVALLPAGFGKSFVKHCITALQKRVDTRPVPVQIL